MKKYWKTPKHKNYLRRRARRSLAARLHFKAYKRRQRQSEAGIPKHRLKRLKSYKHPAIPYTHVWAPSLFSFVHNPEEVCGFVAKLKECFNNRRPVYVVLLDVKEIDYGAINVLLSVMVRFKSQRIRFNGDLPDDPAAKATLVDSQFFEHLDKSFQDVDSYELAGTSSILTHAMRKVDAGLGERIIESASKTVWGERRRCTGVQRTLIELMQNTNNHASLEKEGAKHWWLSVKHFQHRNTVSFSFVDYGVGVFVNLANKPKTSKFFGALSALYDKWRYGNNSDILKLIFQGELHRTASGKPYRGKGLPGIYQALQEGKISNFAMVTNNVFYDSRTGEYRTLSCGFSGTFVYWELAPNNTSLPHEN